MNIKAVLFAVALAVGALQSKAVVISYDFVGQAGEPSSEFSGWVYFGYSIPAPAYDGYGIFPGGLSGSLQFSGDLPYSVSGEFISNTDPNVPFTSIITFKDFAGNVLNIDTQNPTPPNSVYVGAFAFSGSVPIATIDFLFSAPTLIDSLLLDTTVRSSVPEFGATVSLLGLAFAILLFARSHSKQ